MKLGAMFKKLKSVFNYTSGIQGSATLPGVSAEGKLLNVIARHTGVYAHPSYTTFDIGRAIPTWQGIITEGVVQMFDSKTRHSGNITKHKLLDIAEEAIPIMLSHTDASGSANYGVEFTRSYHKYTQGYDMHAGGSTGYGDWDLGRATPYFAAKGVRWALNATGIVKAINKRLPKGINL